MKRRQGDANDDASIHEEMLRHLKDNPPPAKDEKPSGGPSRPGKRPGSKTRERRGSGRTPPRPSLMLRRLRADLALDRLVHFLTLHHKRATPEVLVIVGRGRGSPQGEAVLGPAVRELCRRRSDLVKEVHEAQPAEGGQGALIVRLKPPD